MPKLSGSKFVRRHCPGYNDDGVSYIIRNSEIPDWLEDKQYNEDGTLKMWHTVHEIYWEEEPHDDGSTT